MKTPNEQIRRTWTLTARWRIFWLKFVRLFRRRNSKKKFDRVLLTDSGGWPLISRELSHYIDDCWIICGFESRMDLIEQALWHYCQLQMMTRDVLATLDETIDDWQQENCDTQRMIVEIDPKLLEKIQPAKSKPYNSFLFRDIREAADFLNRLVEKKQ